MKKRTQKRPIQGRLEVRHEELWRMRNRVGLTQEGMADALGVKRQTFRLWEVGARRPTVEQARAWAALLGAPLGDVV